MTFFIASATLLTLLVLTWLLRPLLRPAPPAGVSSQRLNAAIYQDMLVALERDLASGIISAQEHAATCDELQLRLLDDTEAPDPMSTMAPASFWTARRTAVVVALLLPLGSAGVYGWLGAPAAIDPVAAQQADEAQVTKMVDGLAARLQANPDNPKGWAMLARSYKAMGRLDEAEQAFAKAGPLLTTDPDLMVDLADLLAVRAGNAIEGRALDLVNRALALDPQHPMGLMLSGIAAYRRSDFAGAVVQWEKLRAVLEPGSPDAQQVEADIALARSKGGLAPASVRQ